MHEVLWELEERPEATMLLIESSELNGLAVFATEDEAGLLDALTLEYGHRS